MRKLFFLLLAAVTVFGVQALTVNNTAGQLSQKVTNHQITELNVTGTMDARDFLFITEELTELTKINLSQVSIVPVNSGTVLYGTVASFPANEIPRTAFFGKKLTSVTLPANIESVGYAAFAGCYQLTSVTLPASLVAIDDFAFAGSALTSVVVPSTVQVLGKGVFSRCEALQSVTLDVPFVGDYTFLGDIHLTQVNIGPSVGNISKGMFNGCTALTSINFDPACHMTRIDDEAFINSGLQNIDINTLGIGTIGEWALAQTSIGSLNMSDGMTVMGEGALAHNPLLTSVVLPGMGQSYPGGPNRAPHRPHTLAAIADYAFAGDGVLQADGVLRSGVNTIGNYAFYNVSADMDTMWLPASVTYLGDRAMAGMTGMRTLKVDAVDVPALGENVWEGVDQPSVELITPSESTGLYKVAAQWENFFFAQDDYILGDVNNDGVVNIADVTALINALLTDVSGLNQQAADVNKDGTISIGDVTTLINMLITGTVSMTVQDIHAQVEKQFNVTDDALVLPAVAMKAGQTCTVDVQLVNNERLYTALQCELVLPQGVELEAVKGIDRGASHEFYTCNHDVEKNVYTIMGLTMDMLNFDGNEGNVMRLSLKTNSDFDIQDAEVTLANVVLATDRAGFLASDAMTRINDGSGIEQISANKEITGVRYINVAGQESNKPFDGVNIVVTTYTDGTSTTTKIIK